MDLKDKLLQEEKRTFRGWDFSYLKGRMKEDTLPWDYQELVQSYVKKSDKLLDMGTGGGEFLLSLNHPYHLTSVTEGYQPNYELCKKRLVPLGITLQYINEDDQIPYEKESFDVVINKHESYDIDEVYRVLKPNGYFITQQVGGTNNLDLSERLGCIVDKDRKQHDLASALLQVNPKKFDMIYHGEAFPKTKFFDLGAVVYYAKILPWEFKNFSVEDHFEHLKLLEQDLANKKYIETSEHRFILILKKIQ